MDVTPHTRVGELLDAHPEIMEVLIAAIPAFDKLRNPILRATVAKFATLEQAAKVGGIALPDLIRLVQEAIGSDGTDEAAEMSAPSLLSALPDWFREADVIARIDVADLLAKGGHPLMEAKRALASGSKGSIVVLESDFEPAPLLARAEKEGLTAVCCQEDALFRTLLRQL